MTDVVSYDPQELKRNLIEFLQTKPEFADFNYEGSAINTIVDLLVRNTHYIGYMSNMVSTESFLDSAQQRSNVVSHAQKLSYIPKSRTATTVIADVVVTPSSSAPEFNLTCNKGSVFIKTVANVSYAFTNCNDFVLARTSDGKYAVSGVELKQGALIRQRVPYSGNKIEIQNKNVDTSTIRVYVQDSNLDVVAVEFNLASSIVDINSSDAVFFISENTSGFYDIEFGKNILGVEPSTGAVVDIEYVAVEKEHANGLKSLVAATPIGGYSNVSVVVKTEGYGGSERDDIDRIKFVAPKIYEAQNRAVREEDYRAIMFREFPFIKSANAWGGEKNVPPYYGKVFVSVVPQQGFVVAESVKTVIQNRLSSFAVAAITPEVVDAKYIGLDVVVDVIFNDATTTDTFAQTQTKVVDVIRNYNDTKLSTFDYWYNNSEVIQRITKTVPSIYSVEIDKVAFVELDVRAGIKTKHVVEFLNPVIPNTLMMTGVLLDIVATKQEIRDDGKGNVVAAITKNGVETLETIGTIDYKTGYVVFTTTFLSTSTYKLMATPVADNFFVERNYVTYINDVVVKRVDKRV